MIIKVTDLINLVATLSIAFAAIKCAPNEISGSNPDKLSVLTAADHAAQVLLPRAPLT